MNLIEKAKDFAHRAHDSIGQKRKYSGEPYWVHTDAVAMATAEVGASDEVIAAAHLHDYREDVVTELGRRGEVFTLAAYELEYHGFPQLTRDIVDDLTDVFTSEAYPDKNRKTRKVLEAQRLGTIRPESMTVKLADLITNTASIVANDPDFARIYLAEKLTILPYLSDGSPTLLQQASLQVIAGHASLGLSIPTLAAPNLS